MADEEVLETFFTKEQSAHLPTVRIKEAILEDFKSVEYGEIIFNCGKQFVPKDTESDILGVYGQNGSGKTALIEALFILKCAMSGKSVPKAYTDCIAIDKEYSKLTFVFDLQYEDDIIREATYSFCVTQRPLTEDEMQENREKNPEFSESELEEESAAVIFNEKYSVRMENATKQLIIDTSAEDMPFYPSTKLKKFSGHNKSVPISLSIYKEQARNQSRSFIFAQDTMKLLFDNCNNLPYFQILAELRHFAKWYLCVENTKSTGIYQIPALLPIHTRGGDLVFGLIGRGRLTEETYKFYMELIDTLNPVLSQLVPGLSMGLKVVSEYKSKKGEPIKVVESIAYRDGQEMPLRYESLGVRKMISFLYLYIAAFNGRSVTVALDEFDAGIYEYLLGELVEIMEKYGKGQFIFTSHNLRPLEVLDKKFVCFTTANPQNRYFRLKNVGATNNLRDLYYREIIMNEQNEPIYRRTNDAKIIAALKKAGVEREE